MKVLVTGHNGYIGSLMGPMLLAAGHDVVGLDNYLFEGCSFGEPAPEIPSLRTDIRDVVARDLEGFDAIVHLAGISDDPVGALNPECTYAINHRASVRLARVARQAGVKRFVFSSSCSLYGAAGGDAFLTEDAEINPVTAYGKSKALVERDVSKLATDSFSPTFLRNATVFGASPQLRTDLVVNNLVGIAYLTGEITHQERRNPVEATRPHRRRRARLPRCPRLSSGADPRPSPQCRNQRGELPRQRGGGPDRGDRPEQPGGVRRGGRTGSALVPCRLHQDDDNVPRFHTHVDRSAWSRATSRSLPAERPDN